MGSDGGAPTDSLSGPTVVVWPNGGWQVSDAYMAARQHQSSKVMLELGRTGSKDSRLMTMNSTRRREASIIKETAAEKSLYTTRGGES
jgi:hypothetical protein